MTTTWHRMRPAGAWTAALACLALTGMAPPQPDPVAAMRRIASLPYRYGGALAGTVPGLRKAVDQPPVHLSIGLAAPTDDGMLRGEAILFTSDRRLVALGVVSGRIAGGPTPGTGDCTLHLALPTQAVALSGICTANVLSGEITSSPPRPGLLTRVVSWWGDRAVAGRYWLTPASFDPSP